MSATDVERVDGRQLKALLRAYFIISTRAMPVGITGAKRMRTLPIILCIYALLGFAFGAMSTLFPSVFVYSLLIHTMTLFIVGTLALNEASEVLFNSRDGDVLDFRPVNASTLILAKGLTLLGFSALMALAVNLGACALGGLAKDAQPWFGLVHCASVGLETVFVCAAVVFAHGVIVRFLGAERFQRFVTAAQVLSTILLIVGFQVLPRIASKLDAQSFAGSWNPIWLLPSTWFAALDGWLAGTAGPSGLFVPALVGVGATVCLTWFGIMRLPQVVERSADDGTRAPTAVVSEPAAVRAPVRSSGMRYESGIWRVWMRDPVERAVFRLCATQLKRDRSLKVRLAAALAYFLVFPFLFIFDRDGRAPTILPYIMVWMCSVIPLTALELLRISAVPDSAELFLFTPIREPAALLHGTRKAALVFVVFPILVYTLAISVWAARGDLSALWLALPPLILVHPMSMMPGWRGEYVPLSQAPRTGERSAQVLGMFLAMAPLGVLCAIVVIAHQAGFLVPAAILVSFVGVAIHVGLRSWIRGRSKSALRR